MNAFISATDKVLAVDVEPMVAAPGADIIISVTVADSTGALASGVKITLVNVDDSADTQDATTDSAGVAIFEAVTVAHSGTATYEILSGTDVIGAAVARAYDSTLVPPTVTNAMTDRTLDKYDIAAGVQMIIPTYPRETVGDYLTYYWGNAFHGSLAITALADLPKTIDVNKTFPPTCLLDGEYAVFYQYIDHIGNINVSRPLNLTVTGGNQPASLPGPTVPEASAGFINQKIAVDGVDVVLEYPNIHASDALELTWQVYDEGGIILQTIKYTYAVKVTDASQGYAIITISEADIGVVQNGSANLWYTMTPTAGTIETSEITHLIVDTVN